MISKFKKATLPLLALLGFMGLWTPSAQAQTVGSPCIIYPVPLTTVIVYYSMYTCASEATLAGVNDYLQTGQPQGIAGRALQGKGGIVDMLATANGQESNLRKQEQHALGNEDVRDRALAVEEEITASIYRSTAPLSRRACHSAAVTTTAGAAVGGGGGGGSPQRYHQIKTDQENSILTPGTENDYIAEIVRQPGSANSCTAVDVANKFPGCGGVGSLPGVNTSPFILVRSYTGVSGQPSTFTIPNNKADKFYQAQQGYITYSRPRPGPRIKDSSKDNPQGRAYLVLQRRYNSRALVVVNTLTHIASKTLAIDANSPFVANVWNAPTMQGGRSLKEDYREIYGNTNIPAVPSEREIMNLMVLRQFTADQSGKDLGADPMEVARRRLDVKKTQALLLLKLNENAEWNNIMYAHILSSRLDPVTRAGLEKSAQSN